MCFDADAHPPLPPISGGAIDARDLTLTSADGTRFAAYVARAMAPTGAGIVIVPDVRGLHPYYEELALRFAEAGVDAIAFDMYARSAGSGKRDPAFDYGPHMTQLSAEGINADVAATAAELRSLEHAPQRVYSVGFCIGGRISFLQAATGLALGGVIGFYGSLARDHRSGLPSPIDEAQRFSCPVLGLFGGADQSIPPELRDEFDWALSEAAVEHRFVVYDGAPHSFFDRMAEQHADASADAWRQMLGFIGIGA